jgi:hypothetical protein
MMSAITIFGKSSFIFNFVGYELVIKLLEVGCIFEKGRENKMSKDDCEFFSNQIRVN